MIDLLVHAKNARALKHSALHAGTRLWEQFVAPIDRPGTPLAATKYPPDEVIPGFKQHVEVQNPVASLQIHVYPWLGVLPVALHVPLRFPQYFLPHSPPSLWLLGQLVDLLGYRQNLLTSAQTCGLPPPNFPGLYVILQIERLLGNHALGLQICSFPIYAKTCNMAAITWQKQGV